MPSKDITGDLKRIIAEKEREWPDVKRPKLATNVSRIDVGVDVNKEYMKEAYTIPYLNVETRSAYPAKQTLRSLDLNGGDSSWLGVKYLTNEERDQIDLQARVILTRCADRVKEMEAIEKRRAELVASKINPLTRLLPARLRQEASTISSDFLAAHHSGVTWYLSRRLAEASQTQKEMQEERVKRQLERTRTLGSGAARDLMHIAANHPPAIDQQSQNKKSSWLEGASSSLLAATLGTPSPSDKGSNTPIPPPDILPPSDDEDEELELSSSQILQFETENANILQSVQDTLESVQQAEARLMDISALQMELVNHLTRQTELTDRLYEDAIATTSMVEKGNIQLKEAKRRAKDSRLYILVFLIGASMSLLFLHYY
ncbi:hypothetical protein H0H92_010525 [Tricholoma furcatifolium]|nr:hypothetical protein H0H92_010525 [Tricholoma furcatifolium]